MVKKRLQQVEVESGALVKEGSDVVLQVEGEEEPCVARVTTISVDKKDNAKLSVDWYYFPDDVKRGRQSYHARDEIFRSNHHQDQISSKTVIWTCTVLPLIKWMGFLGSSINPTGPVRRRGPVVCDEFDAKKELAACKSICTPVKARKKGVEGKRGQLRARNGTGSAEEEEDGYDSEDDKNRVYLCRHEYLADKDQWKDEEVPVFCTCDLPYNPDMEMVQCHGCGEWYHPRCLSLKEAQVTAINEGEKWMCPTCVERDADKPAH